MKLTDEEREIRARVLAGAPEDLVPGLRRLYRVEDALRTESKATLVLWLSGHLIFQAELYAATTADVDTRIDKYLDAIRKRRPDGQSENSHRRFNSRMKRLRDAMEGNKPRRRRRRKTRKVPI